MKEYELYLKDKKGNVTKYEWKAESINNLRSRIRKELRKKVFGGHIVVYQVINGDSVRKGLVQWSPDSCVWKHINKDKDVIISRINANGSITKIGMN